MPELPEVETVRRELSESLKPGIEIERLEMHRPDLRFKIPIKLPKLLAGARLYQIRRRAKYLLWEIERETVQGTMLSHLGMTGAWRFTQDAPELHDHVSIYFRDGRKLVYSDPRRFGYLDWIEGDRDQHKLLRHLGPEPIDEAAFTAEYLFTRTRKRPGPIKSLLMNQNLVVGVGNIYASEALFRAGLRPLKPARSLRLENCEKLVQSIREVLWAAIDSGGSTIRDYKNVSGGSGEFAQKLMVYDRVGEKCRKCKTAIKMRTLAGRSTYWCPACQS